MARRRTGTTALFGLLGVVAAAAAPAFACSDNASITSNPSVGLAGSQVTVTGKQFNSPDVGTPVEIRWNSSTGALLGSAAGMSFSVTVQIPANAAPSNNYIVAVQRLKADNSTSWVRATPFEVTAPTPAPTVPAAAPASATDPTPVPTPSPTPEPATSPTASPAPAASTASSVGTASGANQTVAAPAAAAQASPNQQTASFAPVVAGSKPAVAAVPAAAPPAPAAPPAGAVAPTDGLAEPAVVATSDVPIVPDGGWSAVPADRPAVGLFTADPAEGRHGSSSPVGNGLFVLGLLTLLGAGVVAGQRRLALNSGSKRR